MFSIQDISIASLPAGTAVYTPSVNVKNLVADSEICLFYSSLTTTSIAITQRCSMDGLNWFDPVNAYNVSVGAVATVANGTPHSRFIQLTAVYAPYIRFKVTATGTAGSITMKMSLQEE